MRQRIRLPGAHLDERSKRLWAGTEAISLGYGGTERRSVAELLVCGSPRDGDRGATTIRRGIADVRTGEMLRGASGGVGWASTRIVDADPAGLRILSRTGCRSAGGWPPAPTRERL